MTKIEHVARSLHMHQSIEVWSEAEPSTRIFWLKMAGAAIEAMREPTQEMVRAGAFDEYDGATEMTALAAWELMIDAALKEKP